MDSTQSPIQPPPQTLPEVLVLQPKPNYLKIIILSIFVITTLSLISYLSFQNQKLQKLVLNPQLSPTIQAPSPTPQTVSSISIPPDETVGWKTYSNEDLSFKYPTDWTIKGTFISSIKPKINIVVESKDSSLMNECMQEISLQTVGTVFIKKFIRVTTGEMCSTTDSTPREIWIIPSATKYAPGISYKYSGTEATQAESVFDQILSTFKFLQNSSQDENIRAVRSLFESRYLTLGLDPSKVKINEIMLMGKYTDKYIISYVPSADYVGGGVYVLIGNQNGKWIMPESGDVIYCDWVKNSGADESTIAFMGPTCK